MTRPAPAKVPDRRPERSRRALVSALVELILERGYEMVTVADVAERANVGRSTLYAHFGGLDGVLREALTAPSSGLARIVDGSVTTTQLAALLDHFKRHRSGNAAFLKGPLRVQWVRRLADLIEPRLEALGRRQCRPPSPLGWKFVALQIGESQVTFVANWLAMRPALSSETTAGALISMTHSMLEGLLPAPPFSPPMTGDRLSAG